MNRILGILLWWSWLSCSIVQAAPDLGADGPSIQVGTYNIEFFGGEREPLDGVVRASRSDAQIAGLANRVAKELDLEVVVFQEINTHSDEWSKFKEILKADGYQFFEGLSSDRNQFVVLAWDADEVALLDDSARELDVRNRFDFGEGCLEQGLRKPVAANFRAGSFDFWVVGVHLKSRRGEAPCSDRVRIEQCRDLLGATDELIRTSGERDVLLVGDFNNWMDHPSLSPLIEAGFIPQMKFLAPQSARGSFVKNDRRHETIDLIDLVFVRDGDTQEAIKNSASVMRLDTRSAATQYILEQSDHVPAWAAFRTDADLD